MVCDRSVNQDCSLFGSEFEDVYGQVGLAIHQGDCEAAWSAQ